MKYNKNFQLLQQNYLFAEVAQRVKKFKAEHPEKKLINLGIGDVSLPLVPSVIDAGKEALSELSKIETFKGYGKYEGYEFLRKIISLNYQKLGVDIAPDEVFIGDGAKNDMSEILGLFNKSTALIPNPTYPVYLDTNVLAENAVIFAKGNLENGFLPVPDARHCDLIYICSPANPTGAVYSYDGLAEWVDYAIWSGALILFDAAYKAYITEDKPRSIFEIESAKKCAIEFCSLSKSAGFTGVRCGWTVIPKELEANKLWLRKRSASHNGTSYIVQKMAAAALSKEGKKQTDAQVKKYLQNAKKIADELTKKNVWFVGGKNSPYIWMDCKMDCWQFFDMMLHDYGIIGIPGSGFGGYGSGFFRLSAFGLEIT